jgi:integrase
MAKLLYGAGLRLMELLRLRVKDLDFDAGLVIVRCGKGDKDRTTLLPVSLREQLLHHLESVRQRHQADLAQGYGVVKGNPWKMWTRWPR